jgi:hypothetical protein
MDTWHESHAYPSATPPYPKEKRKLIATRKMESSTA